LKAYLEIITDEVRQAKIGEYYLSDRDVMRRDLSSPTNGAYPIVTRHEIPIPDGAKILHYWLDSIIDADVTHINLPRPKKKVKKTVYLYVQNLGGKTVYSVFENAYEPNSYPVEIEVEE
jgi:hypothetical protein